MKIYRVGYYTMAGYRDKVFNTEAEAKAFYDRHIKAHPEYQDRPWSRTEILTIAKPDPDATPACKSTSIVLGIMDYLMNNHPDANNETTRDIVLLALADEIDSDQIPGYVEDYLSK